MKYSQDISKLTIRNIAVVEDSKKVVEDVGNSVFRNINDFVRNYLQERISISDKSVFDLYGDDEDKLTFMLPEWIDGEGDVLAGFGIGYDRDDEHDDFHPLSHVLGYNGAKLEISFWPVSEYYGFKKAARKKLIRDFYTREPVLSSLDFKISEDQTDIVYEFCLDKDLVEKEYPDLEDSLQPLSKALESTLEALPCFRRFIEELNIQANNGD